MKKKINFKFWKNYEISRVNIFFIAIILMFSFAGIKLFYLSVLGISKNLNNIINNKINNDALVIRKDILDRNGNVLAVTVPSISLYLKPKELLNKDLAVKALMDAFKIDEEAANKLVYSSSSFVWVKRNITPEENNTFRKYGIVGAFFQKDYLRFYPYGSMFSHIVGITNIDGEGISGVEHYFNNVLNNKNVNLSLDLRMQMILYNALKKGKDNNQAKAAFGMIINPKTSEVLALVSLPDFDPNERSSIDEANMFNRVTQGVYEQGSTFKLLTTSIALDSGYFSVNDTFDVSKPIVKNNYVLVDFDYMNRSLILPEVLIYSSNVASALIGESLGERIEKKYYNRFKLFDSPSLEISEKEEALKPRFWNELTQMVVSYGYAIAVSQAQLANVIQGLINNGQYIPLTLVKREENEELKKDQIIREETSNYLRRMTRLVVTMGSGREANIKGYNVGGKTGSAEKTQSSNYDLDKQLASFVAFFPAKDPQYLIVISIDEPKRVKYNRWNITGGRAATPVAGEIIKNIVLLNSIHPYNDDGGDKVNANSQKDIIDFVNNIGDDK